MFLSQGKKIITIILLATFVISGIVFFRPAPARAILVEDLLNLATNIKDSLFKVGEKALDNVTAVMFKNSVKYFLNNLAYNAATSLVEGGTGKTPLFPKLPVGEMLKQAGGDALGEFVDSVVKNGFAGFDICNPGSLQTNIDILMPAFKEADPGSWNAQSAGYKAKCSWQDIKKNWKNFKEAAYENPSKFLFNVRTQFQEGANDISIGVNVKSRMLSDQQNAKTSEQTNLIANQYLAPVVSPISKIIKTPSSIVRDSFSNTIDDSGKAETTFTGDLLADALGIFTNTLAAKLQKKLLSGLSDNSLPGSKITLQQINSLSANIGSYFGGGDVFADFKKINVVKGNGQMANVFEKFASARLPGQGDDALIKGPGATSEVLPEDFLTAARQELTVGQAIEQKIINNNIQFGFKRKSLVSGLLPDNYIDEKLAEDDGRWQDQLTYRGLLISRIHRIVPQSWELAALFWRYYDNTNTGPLTLQRLLDCYADKRTEISPYGTRYSDDPRYPENCRVDMNGNGKTDDLNPMVDYNPYFHLVDPNWVLKLPASKCLAQGAGPEITYKAKQCTEDNVDSTKSSIANVPLSRGEGTPICDANQAKSLGITDTTGFKYDKPVRILTRDNNYCADWQSCISENANGDCQAFGYCLEEKPTVKLIGNDCSFPSSSEKGLYSSCDSFQVNGGRYNFIRNTLKSCLNKNDVGCQQYATTMKNNASGNLSWDLSAADSSLYLNSQASACDQSNVGCTKVASYNLGTNLLYNGDFSTGKISGGNLVPAGWQLQKTAGSVCDFIGKYNGSDGATLSSDGQEDCAIISDSAFLAAPDYSYKLKFAAITEENAKVSVVIKGVNNQGQPTKSEIIAPLAASDWQVVEKKISLGANADDEGVWPLVTTGFYVQFVHNNNAGNIGLRNVELSIINAPLLDVGQAQTVAADGQQDYERATLATYKLPPAYLHCDLYNQKLGNYSKDECLTHVGVWNNKLKICAVGGSSRCDQFVPLCSAQDVGCQMFKSGDGYLDVPAKISGDDICPLECVGYDSYSRQPSFFEANEFPSLYTNASTCVNAGGYWQSSANACIAQTKYVNLIPDKSAQCSSVAVGCQSFTNLSAASSGGEQIDYFTYLRPCVTETVNTPSKVFYTWEGSDTKGYQLKKWTRLISNLGNGLCTNIDADTGACLDTGAANVWTSTNTANTGNRALCQADDLENNPDCRDFFDINDVHYYVLQSRTVVAKTPKSSDSCVSFRNNASGKIYNADPSDGIRCQAEENGCRAFKGGISNNVNAVVENDFENGTIDNWLNSANTATGLTVSNESLRQGGQSLLAAVADDTIVYSQQTDFIKSDKEYTLVFLAKKIPLSASGLPGKQSVISSNLQLIKRAQAQTPATLNFVFTGNLQNEWREYRLGPLSAGDEVKNIIKLKVNNLNTEEVFVVDNIRLVEGQDIYYLIDNSWSIPVSCDNPINNLQGCDATGTNCNQRLSVGAQMGCKMYYDKQGQSVAIKSFTQLCSPAALDCQAFINTYNSQTPGAINETAICDNTNGVIINGVCTINGIAVCKTNTASSCYYTKASVPADELIYFSPSSEYTCNATNAGCIALGQPQYNLQSQPAEIKNFTSVYKINNPDKYNNILCGAESLLCALMVDSSGRQEAYINPLGYDNNSSRLCFYDVSKNKWVKQADSNQECDINNPTDYLTPSNNAAYRGWVGLCSDQFVGCKEYRNPEYAIAKVNNWCDISLSSNDYGDCDITNGDQKVTNSTGNYCQKKISGIDHLVCKLDSASPTKCQFSAAGNWYCFGDSGKSCKVDGKDVCLITGNNSYCSYSPLCRSAYVIGNSAKQCASGKVDRQVGCAPFYDVDQLTVASAAGATKNGNALAVCDASAKPGDAKYCNTNIILENHLSRQCSEWLFCTSSAKVDDQNVCYNVGRCVEGDPNSASNCLKTSSQTSVQAQNQTLDFGNLFDRERVRYLTGYSHAGLKWADNKIIPGYIAPEAMKQASANVRQITNSDFEAPLQDDKLKGWTLTAVQSGPSDCDTNIGDNNLDTTNPWEGDQSLKIHGKNCSLQATNESMPDYFSVMPGQTYSLSFAARSASQSASVTAFITYYDINKNIINGTAVSYFSLTTNWQSHVGKSSAPNNARYGSVEIVMRVSTPEPDPTTFWLDNIVLSGSLQINQDRYVANQCRLYPATDAEQCSYTKINEQYNGWQGYCLEEDPYVKGQCLQWYPVEQMGGDSLNGAGAVRAYDNRNPLFMCLASSGNYSYILSPSDVGVPANICDNGSQITYKFNNPSSLQNVMFSDLYGGKLELSGYNGRCDSGANDWNGFPGEKVLVPGYWNGPENKKLPALWYGGIQGGDTEYYDNSSSIGWPYDKYNWNSFLQSSMGSVGNSCLGGTNNCNRVGYGILFNEDRGVKEVVQFIKDGSAGNGGIHFNKLNLIYKESCEYIAQVVDNDGANKVFQDQYQSNWFSPSNKMGYQKNTFGTPYGSLVLNENNQSKLPNEWDSEVVPFVIGYTGLGIPLSTVKNGGVNNGAYCQYDTHSERIGNKCIGSGTGTDKCEVCSGVGIYKYLNISNNKMTNDRCKESTAGSGFTCRQPDNLPTTKEGGLDILKSLFAKVYGFYKLVFDTATGKLKYQNTNEIQAYDLSQASGGPGKVYNIKVNGQATGNLSLSAPGSLQTITFLVDIPDKQLPIKTLKIDWGDHSTSFENNVALNERTDEKNPFTFNHWYGCVPDASGNKCRLCSDGQPATNGTCVYSGPKIFVKDNWDWCAGASQSTPGPYNCTSNYINYSGIITVKPR